MEFARPATWDDVKTLSRYLDEAGVEYELVGGMRLPRTATNALPRISTSWSTRPATNLRRRIVALSRRPNVAARGIFPPYAIWMSEEFTAPAIAFLAWDCPRSSTFWKCQAQAQR